MEKPLRQAVETAIRKTIDSYGTVVREERFFCAVLFHLLLSDESRIAAFLKQCGIVGELDLKSARVFVEYAMVRDLWNELEGVENSNRFKIDFILEWLDLPDCLRNLDVHSFNGQFVSGIPSNKYIQSPARWGVKNICKSLANYPELIKIACKFKWSFNIKPDIVIELDRNTVVCIEAKVESGEGGYPSSKEDKAALRRAALPGFSCGQLELQEFVMKKILGFDNVEFVFLTAKGKEGAGAPKWSAVFKGFETENPTVQAALRRIEYLENLK